MAKAKIYNKPRNRTIRWSEKIDKLAVELAHKHCFENGVSELLARLVLVESRRKRGVAHLPSLKNFETKKGLSK